jgi:hypothetical protein
VPISYDGTYVAPLSKNCSYVLKIERDGFFTHTQTFSTTGLRLSRTFKKDVRMPRAAGTF